MEELLGNEPFSLKAKVAANGGDNWRPDVAKVQVLLDKAGYHSVRPDEGPNGYHSSTLYQDIRRFQKDNKLVVDGKLAPGGETIRAIQKSVMMNPKLNGPGDIPKLKRAEPTEPAEAMPAVLKTITGDDKPPPVKLAPGRRLFKEPDQKSEAMFEELVKNIFEKEGGYSDQKDDKGGKTNYRITQYTLESYQKNHGGMGKYGMFLKPEEITQDQAKEIYRNEFFYGQRLNEISDLGIASALVDSLVLHGPKFGWQLFQKSGNAIDKENNLVEDGNGGSKTIQKINKIASYQTSDLLDRNYTDRLEFLSRNIKKDPDQKAFEKGWINRLGWVNEKSKELSRRRNLS